MHTILDLQADWSNTEANKSLKQALIETSFGSFLTHDYRAKLAVITNKDNMFSTF